MKRKVRNRSLYYLLICLSLLIFATGACDFADVGSRQPTPPEEPKPPADTTSADTVGTVPADGVLEAVTWNLEQFSGQPGKTKNDIVVLDSLRADLYAFEEVRGKPAVQKIADQTKGYKIIFDDTKNQDNAFLYNTNTITPLSSGKIDANDGQTAHEWAGRFPFYFSFNYNPGKGGKAISIYAVVIHAKANFGNSSEKEDSYQRRKNAAEDLYRYLTTQKPDVRIILLGDFNDDTDVSIYDESSPSPYKLFVNDTTHYTIITKPITRAGQSSFIGDFSDLNDHIFISNEMDRYYIEGSAQIYFKAQNFISNYENTTSDHLPVWAKFDMKR